MNDLEFELKQATLNELEDHLSELGEILNHQQYSELEIDDFDKIFRIVHSIKGNTRASGFDQIAEVSHKYESKMIHVKSGDEEYTKAMHEMSLSFLDKLSESLEYLKKDFHTLLDFTDLLNLIETVSSQTQNSVQSSPDESLDNDITSLIVDDDRDVQEIVKTYISGHFNSKFQLELNGQDALDRAKSHKFDIIICDYKMPVLDGKKFIEQIRSQIGPNQYTPIIFLSGYKPKLEADENMWKNVFFIEKPFAEHKLIYYIKCSLELSKTLEAA
jgi:CheY-like chemotaxis protein